MPFRDTRAAEVVREVVRRAAAYRDRGIITDVNYITGHDDKSLKPMNTWSEARLVVLGVTFVVRSYTNGKNGSLGVTVIEPNGDITQVQRDGKRASYKVEWGDIEYDTVQTAASYILLVLRGCYPSWVEHGARGFAASCSNCPNQMMCLTDDARA